MEGRRNIRCEDYTTQENHQNRSPWKKAQLKVKNNSVHFFGIKRTKGKENLKKVLRQNLFV